MLAGVAMVFTRTTRNSAVLVLPFLRHIPSSLPQRRAQCAWSPLSPLTRSRAHRTQGGKKPPFIGSGKMLSPESLKELGSKSCLQFGGHTPEESCLEPHFTSGETDLNQFQCMGLVPARPTCMGLQACFGVYQKPPST